MQNNFENCQIDLSELLKRIRNSIRSIRQTINYMNARQKKTDMSEQLVYESIYELLSSLRSVLTYSYQHAKNQDEFHEVKQTHDLINQACLELEYHPDEYELKIMSNVKIDHLTNFRISEN